MSQRSKGACTIAALAVGFGCAVFGVGGADGGTRAYARHVREARMEARLAGLSLDHRSPEQLVLAIRPKTHAAHTAAVSTAVTAAPIATSTATTSTTPATTTTIITATTPTTTSTSSNASAAEGAGESVAPVITDTTTTATTTTGTTTTGTTTTGTTTTGTTTTGTTTTGTTTTGTTTTGTTTAGTTTTSTATNASSTVNGRDPSGATTSTTTGCHGRCEGLTGNSGAVPATLPSTTSSSSANNFSFSETAVPTVTPTASSAVNDATSSAINPTTTTTPATSASPSSGTSTSSGNGANQLSSIITQLERKLPSTSSIGSLSHSTGSHRSGTALPTTANGTGTVPAGGTTGTGPAGTTGTGSGAGATVAHKSASVHRTVKHPAAGSSAFAPITGGEQVIHDIVKVIPTAVWVALGAAFALMLAFAGLALRSSRRARRREKEFAAISAAALTDSLTGILNRRGFTEAAERELARASRYERPFVLAYVDVRGLKAVNDTEGHLMGDELIKAVAGLMKESARADDVVGRIGGDEFALLLGEQTAESAEPVIRRIRARVAEARAEMEISVPWELTIGMASFPDDGATLEELLDLADRRLYEQRGIALR